MKTLSKIRRFLAGRLPRPLHEWFFVSFDDITVRLRAQPPGEEAWFAEFAWEKVVRVRFEEEDMWWSDRIHVYTTNPIRSHSIPFEARGGAELWSEIVRRQRTGEASEVKS